MRSLFLFLIISISHFGLKADEYLIRGKVTNVNTKTSLIGVSVYNLTKQTGTITNEDGLYAIQANLGDVIQYTYIGMKPIEQTVIDADNIDIEMGYLVRKIRDVVISPENIAKRSVLYNPEYARRREKMFIQPKIKTAKDKLRETIPQIGTGSFSPISMIYYAFNKKEQRRLKAVHDIALMDNSNMIYSLEFISMITAVDDVDELKDIKAHCYFPHELVLRSSYYDLGLMLKECYLGYLITKKEKLKSDSTSIQKQEYIEEDKD